MPEFAYTARTIAGQDVNGLISADSRRDVLAMLTERSLFPLIVEPSKKNTFSVELIRPIKTELLAATLTQLSDLLANGVPLLKALEVLTEQAPHQKLQEVLHL